MNGINLSDKYHLADRQVEVTEPFVAGATGAWAAVAASGTVAALNERGGGVSILTQAADNALGSVTLSAKPILVDANKPVSFSALIQFAEAATNVGNVYVGMSSSAVAATLGNDGAGPASSYSGVGLYKVDGSLNWFAEFSNGATQNTIELNSAASLNKVAQVAGAAAQQLIEIDVLPKTSTTCDVIFKINRITVAKMMDQVFTSMVAMAPLATIRSGSTTAETLKVYQIKFAQVL